MRKAVPRSVVLVVSLALSLERAGYSADPVPPDRSLEPAARREAAESAPPVHWAYRSLPQPMTPVVHDPAWCRDPLDAFVLARLEAEGLLPVPECDRRTYLRRVSFDLVGLPPTFEEITAFESDTGSDAYERVVDRLLASPQYGVAQARGWLDLARYADSNGSDENQVLAQAWRYRDYVVDSLNEDKPFGRFVVEQLAGDLLPLSEGADAASERERREAQVATGFLVLGAKMLAESDKEKLALDTCDEQIDVISSALLATTLSCARCHDHKFDPFTQTDYTALAGIFRSTRTFDPPAALSRWSERELGSPSEIAARKAFRDERDAQEKLERTTLERAKNLRRAALLRDLPRLLESVSDESRGALLIEAEDFTTSTLHVDHETFGSKDVGVVMTNREGTQFAEYRIELPRAGRYALELRYASNDSRPLIVKVDETTIGEQVAADATGGFKLENRRTVGAGEFQVAAVSAGSRPCVTLRLERAAKGGQHFPCIDWLLFRPATPIGTTWPVDRDRCDPSTPWPVLRALAEWLARPSRTPDSSGLARAAEIAPLLEALVDPSAALADAELEKLKKSIFSELGPLPPRLFDDEALFDAHSRAELAARRAELATIDARKPADLERALAVFDDKVTELPVFERGNPKAKRGDPIARRTPPALSAAVELEKIPADTSGRLELARWIASPNNPLTARVLVNRVWQTHFGVGLVRTSSNFGSRGEPPTHPELLDALASDFLADGGSRKRLHRRLVLSATYRMGSESTPRAIECDPDGRLLSRWIPRRLSAEAIRDSLLAVSGQLDPTLGGTLITTADREYVPGDPSSDRKTFGKPRRTLYLPRYRNVPFDFFSLFDVPDAATSTGTRTTTTVAPQALWSLNSPFVHDAALALAKRCSSGADGAPLDEPARIVRAFELVLARTASANERERAARFLAETRRLLKDSDEAKRENEVFAAFCEMLFASSAFSYLR